jgi:hypothetical protein
MIKAGMLSDASKIANLIANSSSLTPSHKSMEIGPDEDLGDGEKACTIVVNSEYGNLELLLPEMGITQSCLIDASQVAAVADSLPKDKDIEFTPKDSGAVAWKCGDARGQWTNIAHDKSLSKVTHSNFPWKPPENFARAIRLASSACQAATVSVGLYGVVLEQNTTKLSMMSSNSTSLAYVEVENPSFPAKLITIRPPTPTCIAALIEKCPNCMMDFTNEGVFIRGDWLLAQLPLGQNLEHNLNDTFDKYKSSNEVIKIDSDAIRRFLTRARALSEKRVARSLNIRLRISDGQLVLEHSSIAASSEEYFLASGIDPTKNYATVELPVEMLLVPLEHVEEAILDYLPENVMVLRGKNPDFKYILGGA